MGLVWIFLLALAFMPTCFGLSFFIVYQIWLIRRPEPFFNQTPALRKLYEFAKENNIRLIRTGDSWSIGCFGLSLNFLFVGKNIRFALSRNGLEEIAFAHELGHFLIFQDRKMSKCPHKGIRCRLECEFEAWNRGLALLEGLGFRVDRREYWKVGAFCIISHWRSFSEEECQELFKDGCPLGVKICFSDLKEPFETLFMSVDNHVEMMWILANVYEHYLPPKKIISNSE